MQLTQKNVEVIRAATHGKLHGTMNGKEHIALCSCCGDVRSNKKKACLWRGSKHDFRSIYANSYQQVISLE
jgi:hypothetical protein